MSIKVNKMVLAAGVSALALMVMTSGAMAQEISIEEPTGCEPITIIEPVEPELIIDPVIIEPMPTDPVEPELIIDPVVIEPIEPTPPVEPELVIDPVVIEPIEPTPPVEPELVIDPVVIEPIEPTPPVEPELVIDPVVDVLIIDDKSADAALQNGVALVPAAAPEAVQDRVARNAAVPNLCDTAAGQKNKFFCGSYSKK